MTKLLSHENENSLNFTECDQLQHVLSRLHAVQERSSTQEQQVVHNEYHHLEYLQLQISGTSLRSTDGEYAL